MSLRPVPQGLAAGVIVILLPLLCAASSSPCEPARIALDQPDLPAAWRSALEAVVEATGREGQPWSCTGGELSLSMDASSPPGATLHLRDAQGRTVERYIPTVADLLPISQALLAAPLRAPTASASSPVMTEAARSAPPLPTGRAAPERPHPPRGPAAAREPRILIDGLLGARYGGPLRALWGAGALRIMVPFEGWSAGVWARLGVPYPLDPVPADFSMSEVSIGLSGGRRLLKAPFELTATIDPSIAVISMEGGDDDEQQDGSNVDNNSEHHDGSKVDLRLGAGLRAAFRWTDTWRGIVAIDGELSPAGLIKARRIDPALPAIPAYGVGLTLGVEVVIR